MQTKVLYYGDNLEILRHDPPYIAPESVDLIYLDPPFNSNAAYNIIFKDESGRQSDAEIEAFTDTWHWGDSPQRHYLYLTNSAQHMGRVAPNVSDLIAAFYKGIRPSPMLAYIVEMTVRLVELRRVLKSTGSIWLHCDPTASHYLKLVLDAVFGPQCYRNEIVWKRAQTVKGNFGQGSQFFGPQTDSLLFYTKSDSYVFNQPFKPYSDAYVEGTFSHVEEGTGRRYQLVSMTGPGGAAKGNPKYEVMGVERYWRYSRESMQELIDKGLVVQPSPGAVPRRKYYLDEGKGVAIQSLWDDIPSLHSLSSERLGYPTQKPLALLERIIETSSNPGDVVLDPFCGCGTAIVAAQGLAREWIGIDITYLAIAVMQARMRDSFGIEVPIEGSPTEVEGARRLALQLPDGRDQFELWALTLVGAMPAGGVQKKGADRGVDGIITFTGSGGALESCIVSVKSGHVTRTHIAELRGDMQARGAAMGLFVTLEEPSGPMKRDAVEAGFYHSELSGRDYPVVQIVTIKELLEEHRKPNLPLLVLSPFQKAEPAKPTVEQGKLFASGT